MKVRNDFVTNSSSSSFVIAYRDNIEIDEDTMKKYPFIGLYPKLIETLIDTTDYCDTETADIFTTQQEYDEYFVDRYGWKNTVQEIIEDDEDYREEYEAACRYLADGYTIMRKRVGYSDNSLENFIKIMAKDNDAFVILEDGEY